MLRRTRSIRRLCLTLEARARAVNAVKRHGSAAKKWALKGYRAALRDLWDALELGPHPLEEGEREAAEKPPTHPRSKEDTP